MTVSEPSPRNNRFGSPLKLSAVHWVKPKLVAQVRYLTWTGDGLLRQVVMEKRQGRPRMGSPVRSAFLRDSRMGPYLRLDGDGTAPSTCR
jgi:bifunctional non-homologous end joining protein LigD